MSEPPISLQPEDDPPPAGLVIGRMGVGEILDTGINLARRNYRALVTLVAWAIAPAYGLAAILRLITGGGLESGVSSALAGGAADQLVAFAALSGIIGILVAVASGLATTAITIGYARIIDPSRGSSALHADALYRSAAGRIWALILLFVVLGLAAIPLMIIFPLGIYLLIRWSLAGLAIIIDGAGPIAGIRTSWRLTHGSWWHTFGVLIAGAIVFGLLSLMFGSVGGFLAAAIGGLLGSTVVGGLLQDVVSALNAILLTPFSTAYLVVLYYELRARTEGYDLEQRAAQVTGAG